MLRNVCRCAMLAFAITASTARADVVWDNGTYASGSGTGLSFGWNQSATTPFRFALTDDFTITGQAVLTSFTTVGYMSGNTVNLPQVLAMYVRIRSDDAGAPGPVILGDFVNGVPFTETFTGDFRGSSSSPIYRLVATLPNWTLCSGTYWMGGTFTFSIELDYSVAEVCFNQFNVFIF